MAAAVALLNKLQSAPVKIGCAIAHNKSPFSGTLGAFVTNSEGRLGMLSAYHVLAHGQAKKGDAIVIRDCATHSVAVANLDTGEFSHRCDAAVAWLADGITINTALPTRPAGYSGARPPRLGDILTKMGNASGVTRARVTELGSYRTSFADNTVELQAMYLEPLYDQPVNQLISQAGDSGAVWFDEQTGQAVGLHFAGESFSAYGPIHAKACYMTSVMDALNIQLLAP